MTRIQRCPACDGASFTVHGEEAEIRAPDQTLLPYSAEFTKCDACGEEFHTREQSKRASRAATTALRHHAGYLGPADIVALRERYDITQERLEAVLGLGAKSIVRWEAGTVCQSRAADHLLRELRDSPALFNKLAQRAAAGSGGG